MLGPQWKGPEFLEFEDKIIKVLCFAQEETVKGLQWSLDRIPDGDFRFRLFAAPLEIVGTERFPNDMDFVFSAIDLGQPVPVETLGKIRDISGLISFVHPTPQQLLKVFDLQDFTAISWDGVNFEKIAFRLAQIALANRSKIQRKHFIDSCKAWLKRAEELPDFIEWVNPPDNFLSPRLFALDAGFGILTVGTEGSGSIIKLPNDELSSTEVGEFRFINGQWSFKMFSQKVPVEVHGNQDRLKPRDQIIIGKWILNIKKSPRIEDFQRIARDFHIISEDVSSVIQSSVEKTLAETIKEILHGGVKGELRLASGLKHGSLFFEDAKIIHARTGPIDGRKAVLRMMGWDKMTSKFIENKSPIPDKRTLNTTYSDFSRMLQLWKAGWQTVASLQPPAQLRLKASAKNYLKKRIWSKNEATVFSALCEYAMVRDILNFCPLDDVTIVECLISMRKQGLVELVK
jgi:hypothetical protein